MVKGYKSYKGYKGLKEICSAGDDVAFQRS
jgi:hypothetical protein